MPESVEMPAPVRTAIGPVRLRQSCDMPPPYGGGSCVSTGFKASGARPGPAVTSRLRVLAEDGGCRGAPVEGRGQDDRGAGGDVRGGPDAAEQRFEVGGRGHVDLEDVVLVAGH